MNSDNPDPPGLSISPAISEQWLARKAQHEAALKAEAEDVATKKREHEERIAREKRVVELLEKILEKLSRSEKISDGRNR
jgi:hypothetical protein